MSDILTSKQLDDEEKARLYNQVLQRYLTYYDQRKGQPLNVKIAAQPMTKSEPLVELSKPENSKEIPQAVVTSVEEEVLKSVPKVYKTGARQLLDKIRENRNVLHWNDHDRTQAGSTVSSAKEC